MKKIISLILKDYIFQNIKDGKIDPVVQQSLMGCIRDIEHGVVIKNNKKTAQAVKKMCNLLMRD